MVRVHVAVAPAAPPLTLLPLLLLPLPSLLPLLPLPSLTPPSPPRLLPLLLLRLTLPNEISPRPDETSWSTETLPQVSNLRFGRVFAPC